MQTDLPSYSEKTQGSGCLLEAGWHWYWKLFSVSVPGNMIFNESSDLKVLLIYYHLDMTLGLFVCFSEISCIDFSLMLNVAQMSGRHWGERRQKPIKVRVLHSSTGEGADSLPTFSFHTMAMFPLWASDCFQSQLRPSKCFSQQWPSQLRPSGTKWYPEVIHRSISSFSVI
jgi:hypothetical protein